MNARFTFCGILSIAILCAGTALAQEQESQTVNANNAQAGDSLSALAGSMRQLETKVNDLSTKYLTREEFLELQKIVTKQTAALDALQTIVGEQGNQIRQIDEKYDTAIATLQEQADQMNRILSAISHMDSQNRPILSVANAMQSADFRNEFSGAVDDSLRQKTTGTLNVTNNMPFTQVLNVNGVPQVFAPYTTRAIQVPVGTVTTELAGEGPKNWVVAPPNYTQGVIIAPRQSAFYYTGL